MKQIILNVSEKTYNQLMTDENRIRGSIGKKNGVFDFHQHANGQGNPAAKNECIHRMKHGRVSFSETRMKMFVNINLQKERFALESFVDHNTDAAQWMKQAWLNYNFDMPYGVWNQ